MLKEKQSYIHERVVRVCRPFFVFLVLISSLSLSTSHASEQLSNGLEEIQIIANSGAVSLALLSIEEHQLSIDYNNNLDEWLKWERQRLNIYLLGQRWNDLQQRVAAYEEVPVKFYYWSKLLQVDALLKLKQGHKARQILQNLIWFKKTSSENEFDIHKNSLPLWQKRVIESYLVDNETNDALLAAQRYFQDYASNDIEDRLLRARILLINKREDEVVKLLMKDTKHPEGGMLYLLAQLRSKERPSRKVLQSALRQMRGKWANKKLRYMLWAVVAESAQNSHDRPSTANALEYVLAGHKNIELPSGLFDFSADTLWDAYIDFALHVGNKAQFLVGNDQQWLNAAVKAQKRFPVKARSLYTMVMMKGQDKDSRLRAALGFLNLMHKRKRGADLVMQLFLKSVHYKTLKSIPEPIRYDLVKIALSRSNIELASNLMATIKTAPATVDNYQWKLRRARIFVLGGKAKKGSDTLKTILKNNKILNQKQIDHFLQVIFDLQTIKEHNLAYNLFKMVIPKIEDIKLRREIYYWMADSRKAQQNYAAAARLYLRSALYAGNNGLDPWGQTARYQVAEMLAKAELLQDARTLYKQLLKVTKDPARRAVLKHELQKLWLLKELDLNINQETLGN